MNPDALPSTSEVFSISFLSTWGGILFWITMLGRAYKSTRNGGGLRGLYRGLIYGENVPTSIAKDYEVELARENKRKPKGPFPIALLALCIAFFSVGPIGCATNPGNEPTTTEQRVRQVELISAAVSGIVQLAVASDIAKNPDHRAYYAAASDAILIAADTGVSDPTSIAALVKRYTSDSYDAIAEASLAAGMGLYQSFYSINVSSALDTKPAFKVALVAIAQAINRASSPVAATERLAEPPFLRIPDDLILR